MGNGGTTKNLEQQLKSALMEINGMQVGDEACNMTTCGYDTRSTEIE